VTARLHQVEAGEYQHAWGDKRRPTRYELETQAGDPLGEVETRSAPNMVKPKGLRYTTGQRGFSRWWHARCPRGVDVGYRYYTRQAAVDALVEHRLEGCCR
jgi:hypothetical protein